MIAINLMGGIGNQMFQLAFGKYLSLRFGVPLFLNISLYLDGQSNRNFDLDIFNLGDIKIGSKFDLVDQANGRKIIPIIERKFEFDPTIEEEIRRIGNLENKIILLNGYWQSEQYFKSAEEEIRKLFLLDLKLTGHFDLLYRKIKSCVSVMINVRRGDYLQKLDYHGVVDIGYISSGIARMKSLKNVHFFIFSDDIPWCKRNITFIRNLTFVDERFYDIKYKYYLKLMLSCEHFIISNSTFSWWAAWLSSNRTKTVLSPKKWFATSELTTKDLIPTDWERI